MEDKRKLWSYKLTLLKKENKDICILFRNISIRNGTIFVVKYQISQKFLNNIKILISGFRRDVDDICALLGYYAASCGIFYRRFGITCRSHLQGSRV
jgi:hypothetical protein